MIVNLKREHLIDLIKAIPIPITLVNTKLEEYCSMTFDYKILWNKKDLWELSDEELIEIYNLICETMNDYNGIYIRSYL